jgi:hypothetical protein
MVKADRQKTKDLVFTTTSKVVVSRLEKLAAVTC